ncbi:unnamed protein product [Pleuronectes platessa]|uniref:Uncharacterized protein n=1 Tax=Pleuronectes platessa TaxID=8262 RepID=A0A9N7VNH6_PLEPL|nr:unnamed protein product [Pleuronectes platessa]
MSGARRSKERKKEVRGRRGGDKYKRMTGEEREGGREEQRKESWAVEGKEERRRGGMDVKGILGKSQVPKGLWFVIEQRWSQCWDAYRKPNPECNGLRLEDRIHPLNEPER